MDVLSDTEIYKNTYAELIVWVKELHRRLEWQRCLNINNIEINHVRAREIILTEWEARIRRREFDLMKYRSIMVDRIEEDVVKEYGTADSNVISNDELMEQRVRRGGGGRGGRMYTNYLINMPWGTQFYVRTRGSKTWMLVKFLLAGRKGDVFLLVPMRGDENEVSDDREWLPVESKAFTDYWELMAEFPPPKEEE
jgi:hypothetical protein